MPTIAHNLFSLQAPKAKESWHPNILDALEYGKACRQKAPFYRNSMPQDEDCLFLNIFTPSKNVNYHDTIIIIIFHLEL